MSTSPDRLDEIASDYHLNESVPDMHIEDTYQGYFIEWLLGRLDPKARVLEMGYGDGLVTDALVKRGFHHTLIDGAKTLVEQVREKYPSIECVHSMFETYAPEQPFDVVLASHVLEHVDDAVAVLQRIRTWLKDGGKLIVAVPNRNSIHRQLAVLMNLQPQLDTLSQRDRLVGHQRVYSLKTLQEDIERANMRVVDTAGFFLKVLPNSMMLSYSKELLHALNKISSSLPKDLLANIAVIAEKN